MLQKEIDQFFKCTCLVKVEAKGVEQVTQEATKYRRILKSFLFSIWLWKYYPQNSCISLKDEHSPYFIFLKPDSIFELFIREIYRLLLLCCCSNSVEWSKLIFSSFKQLNPCHLSEDKTFTP